MDRFTVLPDLMKLAIAYVLTLPIGWDREKRDRSAGLRTFPLVAVASCGFVLSGFTMLRDVPQAQARIIEGVITGIGFIGGGAILKGEQSVHGTATAASLWGTGAIGVAVGLGAYDVAVVVAVFIILTLRLLSPLKADRDR
jgi:putative Mg2+ transporter-C (MgtC) family protein